MPLALLIFPTLVLMYFVCLLQNVVWTFGMNRSVPVLNLTDDKRKIIMYPCAHVGVMYDYEKNQQHILQGHVSICVDQLLSFSLTG